MPFDPDGRWRRPATPEEMTAYYDRQRAMYIDWCIRDSATVEQVNDAVRSALDLLKRLETSAPDMYGMIRATATRRRAELGDQAPLTAPARATG